MKTSNEYTEQVDNLLASMNVIFKSTFLKFDKHFEGDKQARNIFTCELLRDNKKISIQFGSSLNDSLENSKDIICENEIDFCFALKFEGLKTQYLSYSDKLPISALKACKHPKTLLNKIKATQVYTDFVKANTNKYQRLNILPLGEWLDKLEGAIIRKWSEISSINFGEGIQAKTIIHPSAYDFLTCLTKNDPGTFENFCGDFGYDEDSRSAERVYKAVCKEWEQVSAFFTASEIELLQEIQ